MADPKSKWVVVGAFIGAIGVAVVAFLIICRGQLVALYMMHDVVRESPAVWLTPVPLTDTSISRAQGKPVTFAGLTFSPPWTDLNETRSRTTDGNFAIVVFASNHAVMISSSAAGALANGLRGVSMHGYTGTIYDRAVTATDYDWEEAMLNVRPDQVRFWMPGREAVARSTLVVMKGINLVSVKPTAIFTIATPVFRGFQCGEVGQGGDLVELKLYDDARSVSLAIGTRAHVVKQADINLIVQSLREAPGTAAPTSAPANP
jgi:hypothetical protein